MKTGNIASPRRYEAGTGIALQSRQMRQTAFLRDASTLVRDGTQDPTPVNGEEEPLRHRMLLIRGENLRRSGRKST
jgi:hypothetical protein